MTITWIDGFDLYTSTNDGTTKYTSWPNFDTYAAGRFGVGQALARHGDYHIFPNNGGAASANLSIGYAAKYDVLANVGMILEFRNGTTVICSLEVGGLGTLIAKRGSTVLGTSAAGLIISNAWHYLETEFTRDAAAGVFKCYLNGVQVLNLTGQNTGASDIDNIRMGSFNTDSWWDDLYCTNAATRLGECRVDTLRPTADTAQKDFTPSTGTDNYAMVDDAQYALTDYVSANAAGKKDYYTMSDLSYTPASIYAVQAVSVAMKDNSSTRTYRANIKSSATEGNGTTRGLGTSWVIYSDIFETDPNGSIAWTDTAVNSLTAGPEVVA